ncbi:type I restriction enzyme specificity protein [Vibrio splendidus 12B01]|uniref:restriction endonuclease subunit S n=1 Tax=Vibrio splendidus TaxID=29497 RepID=UPI000067143E|nr:restriction endonuclease subunit S [Vibrio splendidus]EAP93672.1 type I restriction enzyme specificity protein [Vibrio splendidus 12B01]
MSELPKGWITIKIDSLCAKPKQLKPEASWKFNYIDISSVDREKKLICEPSEILGSDAPSRARKIVNTGDVLVSMTRPNLNAVAKVPEKYNGQVASTGFDVLKPFLIESDWLFSVVRSQPFIDSISGTTIGALYPACKTSDIRDYEMPLPPLAEQKRIVEKLDEVLAQVDTIKARLDGIPDLLKRFRQSVLASAVSGTLTKEWRLTNELTKAEEELKSNFLAKSGKLKLRGKQTNFSELSLITLPDSWTWAQNYKLAKDESNAICAGPFGTIFKAKDFRDEGVPIIFLRHVKEIGFNQNKPNYMDGDVWEELHQEYSVHGGELLVTKLGDPPGECCIYPENMGTAMVTPDVLKMNVDEDIVLRKYLRSYFNSPISTEIIEALAFGATRLRIDIAMFKGFPIPLPSMEEQKEIVRLVDQYFAFADTIEAQVKKAQAKVDNLTQSILAKAFRGELVSQDPSDEPADKLLERIAKAREEAEALAKAAKKAEAAKKRAAKV